MRVQSQRSWRMRANVSGVSAPISAMFALKGLDGFLYKVLLYDFASERETITEPTFNRYLRLPQMFRYSRAEHL